MKLIGVDSIIIWLCWIIRSFIIFILISLILAIISTQKLKYSSYNILTIKIMEKALLQKTTFMVIFCTLVVYSVQITSLSVLVGQIFKSSMLRYIFHICCIQFNKKQFFVIFEISLPRFFHFYFGQYL